jgi:hypothetical protein
MTSDCEAIWARAEVGRDRLARDLRARGLWGEGPVRFLVRLFGVCGVPGAAGWTEDPLARDLLTAMGQKASPCWPVIRRAPWTEPTPSWQPSARPPQHHRGRAEGRRV